MKKKSIQRIILFYLTGIFLSNVFRFDLFHIRESTDTLNILLVSLISPLGAIGLLLGALISSCTVQMEDEEIHELLFGYNRGLVAGVQIGDSWEDIKKNVRPGWTIRN